MLLSLFKRREYWEIYKDVVCLVNELNKIPGVKTIGSCHGHIIRLGEPYVYFYATESIAAGLEQRLRHDAEYERRLNTFWTIDGKFNGDFQLVYLLHAPHYSSSWLYKLNRRKVRSDLTLIADMAKQLTY